MSNRIVRIQLSIAVMIAALTVPWFLADVRIINPRLVETGPSSWTAPSISPEGRKKLLMKLLLDRVPEQFADCTTHISLVPAKAPSSAAGEPLWNARCGTLREARADANCWVRGDLPGKITMQELAGWRLSVSIQKGKRKVMSFSGLVAKDGRSLQIDKHPIIGDAPRSKNQNNESKQLK